MKFNPTFLSVDNVLAETEVVLAAATAVSKALFTALGEAALIVLVLVTVVSILLVVRIVAYARFALPVACHTPGPEANLTSAFPRVPARRDLRSASPSVTAPVRRIIESVS